jgi:hypothetical protein
MRISRSTTLVIAITTFVLGNSVPSSFAASVPANPSTVEFVGTVYDIDYGAGRTQVLVKGTGPTDELVAFLTDDRLQGVFESALITGRSVRVNHTKGVVRAVTLLASPTTACSGSGCVEQVECAAYCDVSISGQPAQVRTDARRALGIILTAINTQKPVSELIVDNQKRITRVKINIP